MGRLYDLLQGYVDDGTVPGAVALVAHGDRVEVAAAGAAGTGDAPPMRRDSIFRIASITKPITAAAVMMLIDEGRVAVDEEIARWLPELASPVVVRTPSSPVDDVVPAVRPITVGDLLTFRAGYGFPANFSLPAVQPLLALVQEQNLRPQRIPATDGWLARLAAIPLLHQPGEAWLYNTCSDLLGVLIERVSGQPLPEFLAERLFEPLGMADTGFWVPEDRRDRLTSSYAPGPDGGLDLLDTPDGQWSSPPAFASGAGGLVSTAEDWFAFGRMLLGGGTFRGRRLLSAESVRLMTTDHLTAAQRAASTLFLEGQGWGFGGSVDIAASDPWTVPGRYGWVGGSGTAAHVVPATGTVTVLLTQRQMSGPTPPEMMRDFWRYAAGS
ncbi:serine hydrolase [Amycolatopsis cynarae]|uniref:Serine hydrolase n=1 Tax=Amycolatopsis cynarae TaxID=2995223 RepID=A0ABY7BA54_9PSEU|nr:serine hydrolase domain-containing protein [Amycolatopsis sp. HUAS 11-8]WAL69236.1 serine hydrolase [Amycolatopsis sp. HUAS 11-8]